MYATVFTLLAFVFPPTSGLVKFMRFPIAGATRSEAAMVKMSVLLTCHTLFGSAALQGIHLFVSSSKLYSFELSVSGDTIGE